ncbi:glutamine amidotransferase-like protein [Microbacterium sp. AG1240]|uniref:class II glutamine amidotransferase n=1 Tax=Microbacterium sp. AG1240 TaxID=2183992 RepID=UPI000EB1AE09|nr:class II glutamine amidotransferase [Microbacterium sp. AG1240]RKT35795.1 glutamine amidotransferase-like protein [Microbacterium sp. AG1240]
MSRMLGTIAPRAMTPRDALGATLLGDFLDLAALHTDGWGYARTDASDRPPLLLTGLTPARDAPPAEPSVISLLYLRFASAGAAVAPENLQPFVADGIAFAHNGALTPRAHALDALTEHERAELRGTTDSEVYFALVRRALRSPSPIEAGVASAASHVRALYPSACLNAMLIVDGALVVVHSRGTVEPPLAAFARRGVAAADLPPGHDDAYNVLATTVLPTGARVVATSGVDTTGWEPLADDAVHVFERGGVARSIPL